MRGGKTQRWRAWLLFRYMWGSKFLNIVRGGSSFFPRGVWPNDDAEHRPRAGSGEPIFLLFWTPISDVFLASTNAMETIVHEQRSGEPILLLFWTPVSDVFLASTNAMETIVHEQRSGEPIFLLFWTPVSDVFLASTNAMETIVHEPRSGEPIFLCYFEPPYLMFSWHLLTQWSKKQSMITSMFTWQPKGGGGGGGG